MTDFERLRLGMVDGQIRTADVTDHRVIGAFLSVPRESFVPEARKGLAYLDARVPLGPTGRAMLEPMILARLVQLAAPVEGERALVVGCGLGYTAAVLAALGLDVVALEEEADLARGARERLVGVDVVEGRLADGAPQAGPYDLIFCDGAIVTGADRLGAQLTPRGRLVAPAGQGRTTRATVFRRSDQGLAAATFFDAAGATLPGFGPVEAFAF
ncbi:protein-L-isoaspartate O-methyltransferase family protein [Chenggangzhangella methanolivorans]|uniref:Protein-L-isoaspartate O-methyltransferase n=1 Tax=Chenggangzhangella methanolivorans TaxID=1437009 RepID=A0A9E6R8W6_9HYPH|nr:protein-L-isoaspartate O-methyltransferase [Chenggangzhangella methanolivorans]QZN99964.1 protein-L-isoaspartate O-methyltransferase [Chenggangzhangella methanolivorans]